MVKLQADTSTQGTQWGTGGMATKLTAARIAIAAGTTMVSVLCGRHIYMRREGPTEHLLTSCRRLLGDPPRPPPILRSS